MNYKSLLNNLPSIDASFLARPQSTESTYAFVLPLFAQDNVLLQTYSHCILHSMRSWMLGTDARAFSDISFFFYVYEAEVRRFLKSAGVPDRFILDGEVPELPEVYPDYVQVVYDRETVHPRKLPIWLDTRLKDRFEYMIIADADTFVSRKSASITVPFFEVIRDFEKRPYFATQGSCFDKVMRYEGLCVPEVFERMGMGIADIDEFWHCNGELTLWETASVYSDTALQELIYTYATIGHSDEEFLMIAQMFDSEYVYDLSCISSFYSDSGLSLIPYWDFGRDDFEYAITHVPYDANNKWMEKLL